MPIEWPPKVFIGGHQCHYVDRDPMWLLKQLARCNWWGIAISSMTPEDQIEVLGLAAYERRIKPRRLCVIAYEIVRRITGLRPEAAYRLADVAIKNWFQVQVWCASHGFDPHEQPIYRTLAAVYAIIMAGVTDDKDHEKKKQAIFPFFEKRSPRSPLPAFDPVAARNTNEAFAAGIATLKKR